MPKGEKMKLHLAGQTFGRLTALRRAGLGKHGLFNWRCKCSCGTLIITRGSSLVSGNTKSCGCLGRERTLELNAKKRKIPIGSRVENNIWKHMLRRCYNQNDKAYKYYGGRGISVCDRWRDDFLAFYQDMGSRPDSSLSIDRIDCEGNYEPQNCRWATAIQQRHNRRDYIAKHGN